MHEAASSRVEPFGRGVAFFVDELPAVWDLNALWIEVDADAGAPELVAEADRLQGAAGLPHRRIVLLHEERWRGLARGLQGAGYDLEVHVVMAHDRAPDRDAPDDRVQEVPYGDVAPAVARYYAGEPWGRDPETRRQLLAYDGAYADSVEQRCFAARDANGDVAAYCKLWTTGATAQIEDVVVLPEHRGTGLGRAVVGTALAAGRALEPELLFIVADDADWPKALYAKLGFTPVGRMGLFTKRPRT